MSDRIAPADFGPKPRAYASLPLVDFAHVHVLACPRGCHAEHVACKAATVVRKGDVLHYTPHPEKCGLHEART